MAVDWAQAPQVLLHLSPDHADNPRGRAVLHRFGTEFGLLPWGTAEAGTDEAAIRDFIAREWTAPQDAPAACHPRHRRGQPRRLRPRRSR